MSSTEEAKNPLLQCDNLNLKFKLNNARYNRTARFVLLLVSLDLVRLLFTDVFTVNKNQKHAFLQKHDRTTIKGQSI